MLFSRRNGTKIIFSDANLCLSFKLKELVISFVSFKTAFNIFSIQQIVFMPWFLSSRSTELTEPEIHDHDARFIEFALPNTWSFSVQVSLLSVTAVTNFSPENKYNWKRAITQSSSCHHFTFDKKILMKMSVSGYIHYSY